MNNQECIAFLQWALPQLSMRWPGFRKVRNQVCKRLGRRLEELQLPDLMEYRSYLESNALEWYILDSLCRITISRFYRDRSTYYFLKTKILPELVALVEHQQEKILSCWCIGAASGEEPYSLSLLWDLSGLKTKGIDLRVLATEVDPYLINRARQARYPESSTRELPEKIKTRAFTRVNELYCLKKSYRKRVQFLQQDIRNEQPEAIFHLILCRNLVYTYFSLELQEEITGQIMQRLRPGGALVLGIHEKLPGVFPNLIPWAPNKSIYRFK